MKTYLVQNGDIIKIGRTSNIERRLANMKSYIPDAKLLCMLDGDVEKYLHKRYDKCRYSGEWFHLTLIDYIKIVHEFRNLVEYEIFNITEKLTKISDTTTSDHFVRICNSSLVDEMCSVRDNILDSLDGRNPILIIHKGWKIKEVYGSPSNVYVCIDQSHHDIVVSYLDIQSPRKSMDEITLTNFELTTSYKSYVDDELVDKGEYTTKFP